MGIVKYTWLLDGNNASNDMVLSHAFSEIRNHTMVLMVSDERGKSAYPTRSIKIVASKPTVENDNEPTDSFMLALISIILLVPLIFFQIVAATIWTRK